MRNIRDGTGKAIACSILALILFHAGCAGLNQPRTFAYPSHGQPPDQQAADRQECINWAHQQTGYDAGTAALTGGAGGALVGAALGAAVGGIAGAFVGQAGRGAALGAAVGGASGSVSGAAAGVESGRNDFSRAFAACMGSKGYNVQ